MPKKSDSFSLMKRNTISNDTLTILVHNVRSRSKKVDDIVTNKKIINIIGFIQAQIYLADSDLQNNRNKEFFQYWFSYRCRNAAILDKFDDNQVIFSFKKNASANRVFTLMLVYRKQSIQMQDFFRWCHIYLFTYQKLTR